MVPWHQSRNEWQCGMCTSAHAVQLLQAPCDITSLTAPQAAQKRIRGLSDDLEEAREPFVADQARGRGDRGCAVVSGWGATTTCLPPACYAAAYWGSIGDAAPCHS